VPDDAKLTIFSTTWCGYCHRLKGQLDRAGIGYVEVDIGVDETAAETVLAVNGGVQTVPTLVFADGSTLTNPSLAEVEAHLAG
jgi:mycoredoxin